MYSLGLHYAAHAVQCSSVACSGGNYEVSVSAAMAFPYSHFPLRCALSNRFISAQPHQTLSLLPASKCRKRNCTLRITEDVTRIRKSYFALAAIPRFHCAGVYYSIESNRHSAGCSTCSSVCTVISRLCCCCTQLKRSIYVRRSLLLLLGRIVNPIHAEKD